MSYYPPANNYYGSARSQPPSPVPPAAQVQPWSPPSGGIQPGSITYTTSAGPDGRMIYHPFKAVPASYQNERGEVIRGIQWVPAEATYVLPEGARPANQDFVQSWGGKLNDQQAKELKDWEKAQLKQIKKEEKKARKANANEDARHSQYGWEQISHSEARDAESYGRERRKSVSYATASPYAAQSPSVYAPPNPAGYPNTMYTSAHEAPPQPYGGGYAPSGGISPYHPPGEVTQQFGEMSVRERRNSTVAGRPYSVSDADKSHGGGHANRSSVYGNVYSAPTPAPARPYSVAQGSNIVAPKAVSPYRHPMELSQGGHYSSGAAAADITRSHSPSLINRSRTPAAGPPAVYPVGHVMEGQPIPNRALSRATTPNPPGGPMSNVPVPFPVHGQSGGISPNMANERHLKGEQLAEPEAFRRAVNAALPYTNFQPMKIQNMDDFREHIPRMPLVLQPHDVTHEDWYRLMQDLAAAWIGAMPTHDPDAASRPSRLVSLLIDQWNAQFFLPRHVEMVLYKGSERRSGPFKGIRDIQIPSYNNSSDDHSSSSSSSSSSSELTSDDEGRYASSYGVHARPDQLTVAREARERRREKKLRKKQKAKEKKARRRQREKEKTYAIYLRSVPRQQPAPAGTNAAIPSYATSPSIPPAFPTGGYASSGGSAGYPAAGPYSSSSVNSRGGGHMSYGGPGPGYPNTGYGGSPSGYAPPAGYASSGGY